MKKRVIKLRSGTVNYGRIFEQKMAALLATRLALDPNVEDFWIASNIEGVGACDDLVLMIYYADGSRKMYLLQLKHKAHDLPAVALEGKKKDLAKDFGLKVYEKAFRETTSNLGVLDMFKGLTIDQIYFVLYTNASFYATEKLSSVSLDCTDCDGLLNTSARGSVVFRVRNATDGCEPLDELFLRQFYLYTDQASANQLDERLMEKIGDPDVSNALTRPIINFFNDWCIGKSGKIITLFKKDIQKTLLEFLLLPHSVNGDVYPDEGGKSLPVMNETLVNFNVTVVSPHLPLNNFYRTIKRVLEEKYDIRLKSSWNAVLTQDQMDSIMRAGQKLKEAIQERQFFVSHLTLKDLYLCAWKCKIVPLVVNCNVSQRIVEKALGIFADLAKDLSFVLLSKPGVGLEVPKGLARFDNFRSITEERLLNENLQVTRVSLQGKGSVKLEEFKGDEDVLGAITPDVYATLLDGVLQVGKEHEVENYYVKRYLRRPLLKSGILFKKNRAKINGKYHEMFIVLQPYSFDKNQEIQMDLEAYLRDFRNSKNNDDVYILGTEASFDGDLIETADWIRETTGKGVHILQPKCGYVELREEFYDQYYHTMTDRSSLECEWLYSNGPTETLQAYSVDPVLDYDENCVPEDEMLTQFKSRTNVINNNAGMGKSFMLKSLAKKCDAHQWVSYVNLSEHSSKISAIADPSDFVEYIIKDQIKDEEEVLHDFCWQVYRRCFNNGDVVWLLDGYDEVSSKEIRTFLESMSELGGRLWITTRPTYKLELEKALDVLALEIAHFRDEDHKEFLQKYLANYTDNAYECFKSLDNTFVRIPLQTFMLAKLFSEDSSQIDSRHLTMVDLYNKFIDVKLKECYKPFEIIFLRKTMSKLALKLFFTEDLLKLVDLDLNELAVEADALKISYKKDSIVTGVKENGDAVFGHQTFAEYLAAKYLAEHITKSGAWKPLVEKLFYIELHPIRLFFDGILFQNLPLHLAVLNDDVQKVKQLVETDWVNHKDQLGRSPLHVAACHGKYYDLYLAGEIRGIRTRNTHVFVQPSYEGYKINIHRTDKRNISPEIVKVLIEHNDLNEKDRTFERDAFGFAIKSGCLDVLDRLLAKYDKVSLQLETKYALQLILYYAAEDNLYHILWPKRKAFQEQLELLKVKYNEAYLTEIATQHGSKQVVHNLITTGTLTVNDGNLAQLAAQHGHVDILELLDSLGADLDCQNNSLRSSPLYAACQSDQPAIVRKLLEKKVNVNSKDVAGMSPLIVACCTGNLDTVKELLTYPEVREDETARFAVYYAACYGRAKCVKLLIDSGLELNYRWANGCTALIIAGTKGYPDVVKELAKSPNCELDALENITLMEMLDVGFNSRKEFTLAANLLLIARRSDAWKPSGGITTLHYTVRNRHFDCVKALVEAGADRHIKDGLTGYTPLIWASLFDRPEVAELLMTYDYTNKKQEVAIALGWAVILGYSECKNKLLNYYDDNSTDSEEELKRIFAEEFGLSDGGANLLLAYKNGKTCVIRDLGDSEGSDGILTFCDQLNSALCWADENGWAEGFLRGWVSDGMEELTAGSLDDNWLDDAWCSYNEAVRPPEHKPK